MNLFRRKELATPAIVFKKKHHWGMKDPIAHSIQDRIDAGGLDYVCDAFKLKL